MHFYKQRKWKRYQLIIFHSGTSYSTFNHGNQFARVQFAEPPSLKEAFSSKFDQTTNSAPLFHASLD